MSSSSTVVDDNPKFTCRIPGLEKFTPARVILDSSLKIPLNHNLILLAKKYRTIIFYNKAKKEKIKMLKKKNIKLIKTSLNSDGLFDLKSILKEVKHLGYTRVLLESGLKLSCSFLKLKLIDNLYLFISNKKIKTHAKNSIKKIFKLYIKNKKQKEIKINLLGEKLIKYEIN